MAPHHALQCRIPLLHFNKSIAPSQVLLYEVGHNRLLLLFAKVDVSSRQLIVFSEYELQP